MAPEVGAETQRAVANAHIASFGKAVDRLTTRRYFVPA